MCQLCCLGLAVETTRGTIYGTEGLSFEGPDFDDPFRVSDITGTKVSALQCKGHDFDDPCHYLCPWGVCIADG